MSSEYVIAISLCCFGIGVGFGMAVPFVFIALYNKITGAFDLDIFEEQ